MIARRRNRFDRTIDPGDYTGEHRSTAWRQRVVDVLETTCVAFGIFLGESPAQLLLRLGQHIDTKETALLYEWPTSRIDTLKEADHWRFE